MSAETLSESLDLSALPALGQPLQGGTFAGLTTTSSGQHVAVVLLPAHGQDLDWMAAKAWANEQGGQLPTRPIAALLFANVKGQLKRGWHWTADEEGASCAWDCIFIIGTQNDYHKSYEGSAVAVRCIPLTA